MKIDPSRLREARGAMTKKDLANKAGVSARQITRLECAKGQTNCHEVTLERLAKALDVATEALMPASPEPMRKTPGGIQPVRLLLSHDSVLKAQLAARRYGMETREIYEIAPLLLTVLAEASLAQRREKLAAFEAQFKEAMSYAPAHLGQAKFSWTDHEQAVWQEKASIDARDLFGAKIEEMDTDEADTPFVAFLNAMVPADTDAFAHEIGYLTGSLDCRSILEQDLASIVGEDHRARYALEASYVRLQDIPPDLVETEQLSERQAWLASNVPDAVWNDWLAMLENIDLGDL